MNSNLPKHIAIIMDGNGRWAKHRQLPRIAGHRAGVENVRVIVQSCAEMEVEALTLFAFSSENWRRPRREVTLLLELFSVALEQEVDKLHQNNVRLKIIGDKSAFPQKLQKLIDSAENLTAQNTALNLSIAANYGGRWDVVQSLKAIAQEVKEGKIEPEEVSEDLVSERLCLAHLPEPDLFIRSGGEQRISNYLLWQLAYTELYFTDCLWPDFDSAAFATALESYKNRQRRFGRTSEQVEQQVQKKSAIASLEDI